MNKFQIFFLLSILSLASLLTHTHNYVFDLGDTLIITDTMKAMRATGLSKFARYGFCHPSKLPSLSHVVKQRLFEVFEKIEPYNEDEVVSTTDNNMRIPQLMCTWMKGKRTGQETLDLIVQELKRNPHYCSGNTERKLLTALSMTMFKPTLFASTRKLADDAVLLIRVLKNKGHKLFVLSNWDAETFKIVQTIFPELFTLFDGIVISGDIGAMKPALKPFEHLVTTYGLNPAECTFIDDQPENCETARLAGMTAVVCPQKSTLFSHKPDLVALTNLLKRTSFA